MKKVSFLIIAVIGFQTSCKEDCGESFYQLVGLPIVELDHTIEICLKPTVTSTQFIINDQATFFGFFDSTCAELPSIDFTQNTFIGYKTEGGGCIISFEKKLIAEGEKYKLVLLVITSGNCKTAGYSYNWILTSKITDSSLLEFEVIQC